MKRENKKRLAMPTNITSPTTRKVISIIPVSISHCKGFLHCVVKGLGVFLRCAKSLFYSVRYINNAETGARIHSQS